MRAPQLSTLRQARFFHSRSSVSPDEILAELLEIEQPLGTMGFQANSWPEWSFAGPKHSYIGVPGGSMGRQIFYS